MKEVQTIMVENQGIPRIEVKKFTWWSLGQTALAQTAPQPLPHPPRRSPSPKIAIAGGKLTMLHLLPDRGGDGDVAVSLPVDRLRLSAGDFDLQNFDFWTGLFCSILIHAQCPPL